MNHPYNQEYFEKGTISNYRGYSDLPYFELLAREIFLLFRPNRVLEVGCAKGYVVKHLRSLGVKAFGVDISKYAVSRANKEVKAYLQVAKVQKLPFPDDYFDVVFSLDLFEHIPEDELEKAIRESLRVGEIQFHLITTKEIVPDKDITHVTLKPLRWWKQKFEKFLNQSDQITPMLFLVESENHWIHDFLKYYWLLKDQKKNIKGLNKELREIYASRGWKAISLLHQIRMSLPILRKL